MKFLQFEDFKASIKNMKKQGKADFFIGRRIKAIMIKKTKSKARQIYIDEEKRQRNTIQKKKERKR